MLIQHLLQLGGGCIDFDTIEAPATFLDQPKALPILRQIAPLLQGALAYLDVDAAARSAADRLPGYFVLALEATWREHIFTGDFSLRQLYQPLRGYWAEKRDDERGSRREVRHVVDLATEFDAGLEHFDPTDALRVVTGGPGSGKSSFVKWWAAHVLHRDPPLPTLVVPLHRLDSFDLEQEVWKHAQEHGFAKNPLALDGGEPRLLLILDGLDELDADHKTGPQAASALVRRVDRLLERNRQGRQLQVVIAGRELVVSALRGELDRERQVFHVLGYLPRKEEEAWKDPDRLLDLDQRQAWWRAWGTLTGETLDDVPEPIATNRQLVDLTDQPLLNHLLAVTRAAAPAALGEQSSINTIYAAMLDHVWQRSWGKHQLPALRPLKKEDFRRLFESIGLAVWQYGGGRTTTLEVVAEIARREKLGDQLQVLADAAKQQALDLLTAFYFRRDAVAETFELTHKSFGEYFAAMRLLRLIDSLHRLAEDPEFEEAEGLRRWYRWTHAARITPEIKGFLERALAALPLEEVQARRATLIRLFDRNLLTGMAHETVEGTAKPAHFREAQRFDAAAELALLAAIGACSVALMAGTKGGLIDERRATVQWAPAWPDRAQAQRTSVWDLLRRLEAETSDERIVRQCMHGMDLDQQIIGGALPHASWTFVSAKWADLSSANLCRADLSGADLGGAYLGGANLSRANLSDANLSSANFSSANLNRANLSDANLSSANLISANFSSANLSRANLFDADLRATYGLTRKQLEAAHNVDWESLPDDLPEE